MNEAIKVKNEIKKYITQEILGPVNAPIFKMNQTAPTNCTDTR